MVRPYQIEIISATILELLACFQTLLYEERGGECLNSNIEREEKQTDKEEREDGTPELPASPTVIVRKRKKKKKRNKVRRDYDVTVIPATKGVTPPGEVAPVKRVAAYCRVSTDEDEQATSFQLQVEHYTEYIAAHEGWVLAGIYADEGISGTQVKHREKFQQMIEDCEAGAIDLIITKSISRFARNTVDCLTTIRKLKGLKNPVEILFEKERLSSLDEKTDMVLNLMASIAQEESRSISANIRWAIRNRMKNGTQIIPTAGLLGYDNDEDGNMIIVEQEAAVVRMIYKSFVQGIHPGLIAVRLNGLGLKTVYGNDWSSNSVRKILRNEKYCGDCLMQKTITTDYLTHASKINEGEADQCFIQDHHPAIVEREVWNRAQELLDKQSWTKWKRREQQRLMPVRTGLLKGFVSISPEWRAVSITRLVTASSKILEEAPESSETSEQEQIIESEDYIMEEKDILKGFEVVELEASKGDSVMTLTSSNLKFNKATAVELNYPSHIRMLINAVTKQVAIEPCKENTKNAVSFSKEKEKQTYAIVVKVPALLTAVRKLADTEETGGGISFNGILHPNERVIIFDLAQGKPAAKRQRRKKTEISESVEKTESN